MLSTSSTSGVSKPTLRSLSPQLQFHVTLIYNNIQYYYYAYYYYGDNADDNANYDDTDDDEDGHADKLVCLYL